MVLFFGSEGPSLLERVEVEKRATEGWNVQVRERVQGPGWTVLHPGTKSVMSTAKVQKVEVVSLTEKKLHRTMTTTNQIRCA